MVPRPEKQHADIYIIETPTTTKVNERGEIVHDASKIVPIYMSDPFTYKNSTFFFQDERFTELLEFARTRDMIIS